MFSVQCVLSFQSLDVTKIVSFQAFKDAWTGGRDLNLRHLPVTPPPPHHTSLFGLPETWTQEEVILYELLFVTGISYFHYITRVVLEVSDALGVCVCVRERECV